MKRIVFLAAVVIAAVAQPPEAKAVLKTDIVFMIDATVSMAGEIAGVRNGFSTFVGDLTSEGVDARYAVVVFGGQPELTLDFTSDGTAAQNALNNIVIGSSSTQNNHNLNPEAGLEAIRMALGAAPVSEFANNHITADGILNFRSDARKNLILVTDEDSDVPFHVANRFPGQTTSGASPPTSFLSTTGWQQEVDATAQAVIDARAYINMLINIGDSPTKQQYGDYTKDISDADLLNFDEDATLAALLADPVTQNSLQAQVLGADLIARSFNVAGANDADFVANFFAAKVEEIVEDEGVTPEPTALIIWSLLGMLGIAVGSRRRNR